ncbi:cysteine peptidase family C39 domain-containing protein [Caulobacter segnis]
MRTIAGRFGSKLDLAWLRRRHLVSARGSTLHDLMQVAASIGLTPRPVRCDLDEINQLQLPCIIHWNLSHYVVLERVSSKWVEIFDPAIGQRKLKISAVSAGFSGVALGSLACANLREEG